jgi:hypothetical protein
VVNGMMVIAVVVIGALALIAAWGAGYLAKRQAEGELKQFKDAVDHADASNAANIGGQALSLIALILNDVDYYAKRKRTRMWASSSVRLLALFCAAGGILTPLIGPAVDFKQASQWGIVGLAAAGICFSANELFGLSKGHARAVIAQYALMEKLTTFRIEWSEPAADQSKLLKALAADAFAIVQAETGKWAEAQEAAIQIMSQRWVAEKSKSEANGKDHRPHKVEASVVEQQKTGWGLTNAEAR